MRNSIGVLPAVLGLIAVSCSSGPQPPQPGTPAFYWGAAKTTYASGDFVKAAENLANIVRTENDFTVRARPALMILSAGMAQGYMDLADSLDYGAKNNRANPQPFRRQATVIRGLASSTALQLAEQMHTYLDKPKVESFLYEFGYPSGSASEPVQLQRVAKGMLFPDAEVEQLQKSMVQRGVLMSVARAIGAGDDAAKALEMFKQPEVKISRPAFLLVMAKALHKESELFGPKKLDQPQRVAMLCKEAEEVVKSLPESKETKDLLDKIAKTRKESKIK